MNLFCNNNICWIILLALAAYYLYTKGNDGCCCNTGCGSNSGCGCCR